MNLTFAVWRVNVNLNLSNNPVHLILLIDSFILLLSILKVNNSSFMANLVPRVLSYPFLRSERARVGENLETARLLSGLSRNWPLDFS